MFTLGVLHCLTDNFHLKTFFCNALKNQKQPTKMKILQFELFDILVGLFGF